MTKEKAISILKRQIKIIDSLKSEHSFSTNFKKWQRDTEIAIERIFGSNTRHLQDFNKIEYIPLLATSTIEYYEAYRYGLENARSVLQSMIQELEDDWNELTNNKPVTDILDIIEHLCNRFILVAKQLKIRQRNRPILEINDEYDVQYLFHALLSLYFDDIRPEEWTPSYAGSASRTDFLLKREQIVIELKKTRSGLADKEVGQQLIIDIDKYKVHADCKTLICFVYDPDRIIANPRGIENDLMKITDGLTVKVFIRPK
ncbi:hypothetical protein NIES4103_43680 [Nostoc sp. NIES-4103]|nr:hypothetical protein NIES4103_43680 [Nostoc sp. NIES-4103]